ncbi:MAG: hypothetical protein GWM98_15925 [Nitrospinaceae bacterium]|nr:hypothetical protein [Nitrospinaceae bacterium]NIR55694.1 hypothetical protein [Nitrospinaceae bacterium]NIS86138.1 hypothetical protein [Nitrospinaceae bacterium]NIT82982.1 hypothetical protein [Nitrospinaceae bacterium]NIU45185.1 hypothetical protein [Nitrospinaceae bacterium]
MITINLFDYKRIVREVAVQKQVVMVAGVGFASVVICGLFYVFQLLQISLIRSDLEEMNTQVAAAKPDYDIVQKLKAKKKKFNEIISGIDTLRAQQARTTELMEDVGEAVAEGVWLTSILQMNLEEIQDKEIPFLFIDYEADSKKKKKKKKQEGEEDKFIELKGLAKSDKAIVHFIEQLQSIPYIDAVVLNASKKKWIDIKNVREFEIYCHFLKTETKPKK